MTETGTQAADAPTAETLRDVREAIPRVVPHGRRTCTCGMVLRVRSRSSEDRHQLFPPGSLVPFQAFLDVWEKNVPISGRSALPPQRQWESRPKHEGCTAFVRERASLS